MTTTKTSFTCNIYSISTTSIENYIRNWIIFSRKFLQSVLIYTATGGLAAAHVNAQTLPPACSQYVKALTSCKENLINYLEVTDPEIANKQKNDKGVELIAKELQAEVKKNGLLKVAKYCVSPEFKKQMHSNLERITMPLIFNQALNEDCLSNYQSLR